MRRRRLQHVAIAVGQDRPTCSRRRAADAARRPRRETASASRSRRPERGPRPACSEPATVHDIGDARCPICRYGVCPRSHSASIIEFSKCVRRHQVTKLLASPASPFLKNSAPASVRPFCMSTMVPYWSNTSTLISRLRTSGISLIVPLIHPNRTHFLCVIIFLFSA